MSVPINQHQLIRKYFNVLVKEFITDPLHNKNISIVFVKDLGSSENIRVLGNTQREGGREHWETLNGVEVLGSRWQEPYIYTISFLNRYKDENELRGTVVHEFTHLYLYSTVDGKHEHDDRFYSTMERLESWFDKNQGLSPRVDKSHDRDQHVDGGSSDTSDKENTCPECFHSNPHHSPQCSHNQSNPLPTRQTKPGQKSDITNDPQKTAEFNRLKKLIQTSRDLATLEAAYQNIKVNSLYRGELDDLYQLQKQLLHSQNNNQRSNNNPDSLNKSGLGGEYSLIILLAIGGFVFLVMTGYLLLSSDKKTKLKKKR